MAKEIIGYVIYKHTNKVNRKSYIGQTRVQKGKTPESAMLQRFGGHVVVSENKHSRSFDLLFQKAIRKYGKENFENEVLEVVLTQDEAHEAEKYWIEWYNTFLNGYNMTSGGINFKFCGETKRKISKFKKGKKLSEETKKKLSKALMGHKISDESILKMLKTRKNNRTNFKPVAQYTLSGELISTYQSIDEAKRQTKIWKINECCIGKRKSAGGFIWALLLNKDITL